MSLKLWLIRHGQTSVNAGIWSDKPAEACLTPLGKEQAMKAALAITEPPQLIITSPLTRAKETAEYVLNRWPLSPSCSWPIQEFIYLSPSELKKLDEPARKELISSYWQKCDPFYCHGNDTESFSAFLKRIELFSLQISTLKGFVVVIGHGQFFKAYQLGLHYGFNASAVWMKRYREEETHNPIKNGEIIKLFFD
ncbi:MAG: histidine phosphatase family protein [Legionella sp.]|nr:histidine phosphatase family protein [Legionella sp.]